jgi:type IV pilus assembly protein PilB
MLGEIFLNAGIITPVQLEEALVAQKKERPWKHLGSILVRMGCTEEAHVAQAIAYQRKLEFLALEPETVARDAARLISARLAEKHLCIPVREEEGELVVAMENPLDLIAIEDVERASERRVRPAVSTPSAILAAISAVYTLEPQRA